MSGPESGLSLGPQSWRNLFWKFKQSILFFFSSLSLLYRIILKIYYLKLICQKNRSVARHVSVRPGTALWGKEQAAPQRARGGRRVSLAAPGGKGAALGSFIALGFVL